MKLYVLITVIFAVFQSIFSNENAIKFHDYCVIGAGPAGLQMGHFLQKSQRDYVIFEKAEIPGNFFVKYPRHRKLISINKRHTGSSNKEFNLRHDWNSLISNDESLLFTKYSMDYFPNADMLLQYLKDYKAKLGIKVQFKTDISNLKYNANSSHEENRCRFSMNDQNNQNYCCRNVIVAVGFSKPNFPNIKGSEYIENYDSISVNPMDYDGQTVLVLGRGNSGMEVASSIYGYANYVHLVGRDRIKFSWETHYVGDIRAVNNEVLDAYMLKSLDGVFEASTDEMYIAKREEDGKLMLRSHTFTELNTMDSNPVRDGYDRIIACLGFKLDNSFYHNSSVPRFSQLLKSHPDGRNTGKFPDISYDYQSTEFPGMFFAGPIAHSVDFKKAAGGFIHGFRYTIRALHRILEWENHGVKWPSKTKPWDQMVTSIMKRANEASGLYQMFQNLCDILIVDKKDQTFAHLEEFPTYLIDRLTEKTGHNFDPSRHALVVLSLEYGANFSKVGQDHFDEGRAHGDSREAHLSNFLHPVIYYYRNIPTESEIKSRDSKETLPKPDGIHHVIEDFTTIFNGPSTHVFPLRKFLEFFLDEDLRVYLAETCINFALTTDMEQKEKQFPFAAQRYFDSEESVLMWM